MDEAIHFFRAQVMFKEFQPDNSADITLVYNTLFIQQCIQVRADLMASPARDLSIASGVAFRVQLEGAWLRDCRLSSGQRTRTRATNC